jgi:nicotinic acid mononucleotide adenylyltransferase
MDRNAIWEGRFQPIHRGHVAFVGRLLDLAETVWVHVNVNETSDRARRSGAELPVPEFSALVDGHHAAEKNPMPFWLRYRMVCETLRAELPPGRVVVWGGRRFDLDWARAREMMPPDRVFATPRRDDFEDAKAAAWTALGERVVRISVDGLPVVSGTQVRDRLRTGRGVEELLCPATLRLLREHGYADGD